MSESESYLYVVRPDKDGWPVMHRIRILREGPKEIHIERHRATGYKARLSNDTAWVQVARSEAHAWDDARQQAVKGVTQARVRLADAQLWLTALAKAMSEGDAPCV